MTIVKAVICTKRPGSAMEPLRSLQYDAVEAFAAGGHAPVAAQIYVGDSSYRIVGELLCVCRMHFYDTEGARHEGLIAAIRVEPEFVGTLYGEQMRCVRVEVVHEIAWTLWGDRIVLGNALARVTFCRETPFALQNIVEIDGDVPMWDSMLCD